MISSLLGVSFILQKLSVGEGAPRTTSISYSAKVCNSIQTDSLLSLPARIIDKIGLNFDNGTITFVERFSGSEGIQTQELRVSSQSVFLLV